MSSIFFLAILDPCLFEIVDKLKVEAIARKALRESCPTYLIFLKLLKQPYFLKKSRDLGQTMTLKLISELLEDALEKEHLAKIS